MIADAVQNVRVTVASSIRLRALLSRSPPIIGPTALARLAPDCITPSAEPCFSSDEIFEARLVSDGDANELPIDKIAHVASSNASPPNCGPKNGNAKRLITMRI